MDNQPLSSRFLKVMQDSIITGTIPRNSEERPHVQVSYSDSNLRGQSNPNAKTIGIIGPAEDGIPNHVYKINSVHQAEHYFGGGPLVKGIQLAWQPGAIAYGNGGTVYAERVQDAGQADLNAGPLHFVSTSYGKKANNTNVSLKKDPLTNTWTVRVTNKPDDYQATYDGIGLLGLIQYVPNAWDKFHIPAGHHDYARAKMEIKPQIKTSVDQSGTTHKSYTGQAAEMVFDIHDTQNKGILHDNATNNVNGGSTIYDTNPNGTESIKQSPNNAKAGDVNPDVGPFQDSTFTVDLTDPKFKNVTDLFNYLQSLPNIEVSLNDDHNLSHIAPNMLDLTRHAVNIMGNIDHTSQDKHGNVVEPAGVWATLADLVDKLRYDQEVHATADLSKQLNDISTAPSGVDHYLSEANYDSIQAASASSEAKFNKSQASTADQNHAPALGSEYMDTVDSYQAVADNFTSLASSNNSAAMKATNSLDHNITSADDSASSVINSESAIASQNSHASMEASRTADSAFNKQEAYSASAHDEHESNYATNSNKASHFAYLAKSIANSYSSEINKQNDSAANYSNVASQETSLMNSYSDLAKYASNTADRNSYTNSENAASAKASNAVINASNANSMVASYSNADYSDASKKADKNSASSFMSLANEVDSAESAELSTENSYASMRSSANSQLASAKSAYSSAESAISKARNEATKEDEKTLDRTAHGNYPNNIRRVKTYVGNLVQQIRNVLKKNNGNLNDNIVVTDFDMLSKIGEALGSPATAFSTDEYEAGQAINNDIQIINQAKTQLNSSNGKTAKNAKDTFKTALSSIATDLNPVSNEETAPQNIFTNDEGEGQIFVLNEPVNAFDDTALTGGYTKPVPASWANKLHYFDNTPVYDFVALSSHESVHAEVAAYIGDRYEASHNMRGFVGAGYNASVQELVSRAAALDNERMVLVGTSGDFTIGEGLHEDIPAYMTAAIVAGIDSSLPVGESILNKEIPFNRIDQNFSNNDLNVLDQNGVITANPVVNRGTASEYTLSDDVTTDNDDADPVKAQLSIGEVTDFLFDGLRAYLHSDIGNAVTVQSSHQLANDVNEYLSNQCSKYNGGQGMIVDFNPDDTYCEIHNESAYIEFSVAPTMPLKFINVIGTYNGYDEDSTGSFNYIGANGQETADNTDADNGLSSDNESSDDQAEDSGNLTE